MRNCILCLLLICVSLADAQTGNIQKVDSLFRSAANSNFFSGVVLVASHGKIQYEQAFGYRDFAKKIPLEQTDVFELASVSKQFTAMVIMMLREKGLLKYDDPLEKYVDIPYKGITIRHLLTHTSGLPDYQAVMDQHWDKSKVAGNVDIIEYLNKYAPPKMFEPGTKYAYSNTGYVMLASVAEKASGRDFISFCNEEIFHKLGMNRTAIRTLTEKARVADFALGHIYVTARSRYVRADSFPSSDYTIWLGNRKGPGRISSTAEDLLKWDQALYGNKLVSQKTLEEAFTPMRLADGTVSNYGFGWMIVPPKGASGKIVWHSGDNPGYKTEITRFIDKNNTLIILCNNASARFEELSRLTREILSR
jgi:CubicO group peptidase (beta-lactamase class C family)